MSNEELKFMNYCMSLLTILSGKGVVIRDVQLTLMTFEFVIKHLDLGELSKIHSDNQYKSYVVNLHNDLSVFQIEKG